MDARAFEDKLKDALPKYQIAFAVENISNCLRSPISKKLNGYT